MANFFEALRSAIKVGVAAYKEGIQYEWVAAGKAIRCLHCGGSNFTPGRVLLNSRGRTFLHLDWTDPSATILACTNCARIEWFAEEPARIQMD